MIAFGFRMLNAELPYYLSRADESVNNLLRISKTIDRVIEKLENPSKYELEFLNLKI
jgi:hypothetical protein